MADGRFDGMLLGMAQQTGGIDELLDVWFSFLARKTDFFSGADRSKSEEMIMSKYRRHMEEAERLQVNRKKESEERQAREEALRKKREEEADAKAKAHAAALVKKQEEEAAAKKAAAESGEKKETTPAEKKEGDEEMKDAEGEEKEENKGKKPNAGNGGDTDRYSWTQTLAECEVRIPTGGKYRSRDLIVEYKKDQLKIQVKGQEPIINGKMFAAVKEDDCNWTLEDEGRQLSLYLTKRNTMEWWKYLVEGEEALDLQKVEPENSKLDDLDADTRQTVEKMMFDQRQKAMGLPTSEEMQKQKVLQDFMKAHPEMDFSKAKFC